MGWFGSKEMERDLWVTVVHGRVPMLSQEIAVTSSLIEKVDESDLEIETIQSGTPYPLDLETGYIYFFREGMYCRIRENLIEKFPKEFEIVKPADVTSLDDKFLYFIHSGGGIARFPKVKNDKLYSRLISYDDNEIKSIILTHYDTEYSSYIEDKLEEIKKHKEAEIALHKKQLEEEKRKLEEQSKRESKRKKKEDLEKAEKHESLLEFEEAAEIYKRYGMDDEVIRVREKARNKVDQTVVHGDYVDDRDTIVKDSVVNKSSIGAGGKSKSEELREAKALLDDGIIDDDEFKQMKKEILGK